MSTIRKSAWIVAFAVLMLIGIAASNRQALASANGHQALAANGHQALGANGHQALAASNSQADAVDGPTHYYYFNFEQGVKPWAPIYNGLDKVPGLSLQQVKGANGCANMQDNAYANLKMSDIAPAAPATLDGVSPLPVGTWMIATIPAVGLNNIRVDYSAANTAGCLGCSPMVYVGGKPPTNAAQFAVDKLPLKTAWQQFTYDTSLQTNDQVFVAIGFNGTNASMGIDCVSITVDPLLGDKITPVPVATNGVSGHGSHAGGTATPLPATLSTPSANGTHTVGEIGTPVP